MRDTIRLIIRPLIAAMAVTFAAIGVLVLGPATAANAASTDRVVYKVWTRNTNHASVEICKSLFNCSDGVRRTPLTVTKYVAHRNLYQVSLWTDTFNSPRLNAEVKCAIYVNGQRRSVDTYGWTSYCAL